MPAAGPSDYRSRPAPATSPRSTRPAPRPGRGERAGGVQRGADARAQLEQRGLRRQERRRRRDAGRLQQREPGPRQALGEPGGFGGAGEDVQAPGRRVQHEAAGAGPVEQRRERHRRACRPPVNVSRHAVALLEVGERLPQVRDRLALEPRVGLAQHPRQRVRLLVHAGLVVLEAGDHGEGIGGRGHRQLARRPAAHDRERRRLERRQRRPARGVAQRARAGAEDQRHAPRRRRLELEGGLEQHAQPAARAAQQAVDGVAGDVLDHAAAAAGERAVAEREARAEDAVARRAQAQPPRARGVGGEDRRRAWRAPRAPPRAAAPGRARRRRRAARPASCRSRR